MTSFNADTNASDVINKLASEVTGKTCISDLPNSHSPLLTTTRLVLITGTSKSGIGAETAITLASAKPKRLILASRTEAKVTPVIEEIKKTSPDVDVIFIEIDLLDNSSVRKAAEKVKAVTNKIHGLVNNAGVMAVRTFEVSKDGIESQFAANYTGHYLLTNLLMNEILAAGKEATIVNVSSLGYQLGEVNLKDPNFEVGLITLTTGLPATRDTNADENMWQDGKNYNPWHAYGQSKTANILFSFYLGKKLQKQGIAVFAVHPGGE